MTAVGTVRKHPEWRLIVEYVRGHEYGQVITHAELSTEISLPLGTKYFGQVARARRALLEDFQIELESVASTGYRLVEPERFGERARRELKLGRRRTRRAASVLNHSPQHLLTDQANAANANLLSKIGRIESLAREILKETRDVLPNRQVQVPKLLLPPGSDEQH